MYKLIRKIRGATRRMKDLLFLEDKVADLNERLDRLVTALGRIEARQTLALDASAGLAEREFRAFSQFGDDGIAHHLTRTVPIGNKTFVEFGVENFSEANCRFLMENDNWRGLVVDSSSRHIAHIKAQMYHWRHDLTAVRAMITRENINDLCRDSGFTGRIGLLSIDIDGNDYWVWEAMDVVDPAIVVVEYNHRFGPERAVAVPYDPAFLRSEAHHSGIYYGASLNALCQLGGRKGYAFVGCNSAVNNAWFVKRSLKPDVIPELTAAEGFVAGRFREARDERGDLAFLRPEEELRILDGLPLHEFDCPAPDTDRGV